MNIKDTWDMVKSPRIREEIKAEAIFEETVLSKIFPKMTKTPRSTTNSEKNKYK